MIEVERTDPISMPVKRGEEKEFEKYWNYKKELVHKENNILLENDSVILFFNIE